MTPFFVDTYYFLALVGINDKAHDAAVALSRQVKNPLVTTTWVLTELGDALASTPLGRETFLAITEDLYTNADVTIVTERQQLFSRGVEFYWSRLDKVWSLTDCISFVVMNDLGIGEVLTGDHHFEQAGFTILFE